MIESGFGLGRIAGVQIRVDWSLLIIFGLVLVNLGAGVLPAWHADWSMLTTWSVAFGAAVAFFASVLVHELSHALVARRHGISVEQITLFLFGGMAHMEREPPSPKSEFWIAIVGPVTSVVIGVVATFAGGQLAGQALSAVGPSSDASTLRDAMADVGPFATLLLWLGPINVVLGIFNIVPGFPLDGGRVLRAVLWWMTDDLVKATRWAARTGQAFAWVLMALGVMQVLAGALVQGMWLVLIGWFLNNAARMSYQQVIAKQALTDVSVRRVMWSHPLRVSADLPVDRFVSDYVMGSEQVAFPVQDDDGTLIGQISLENVREIPMAEWPRARVGELMTPVSELATLKVDADAHDALQVLVRNDVDQVPILEGAKLCGMVRRRDLLKWISMRTHDGSARLATG